MKIHPNKQAAQEALKKYSKAIEKLQEEFGVEEECDRSYVYYYDKRGRVREYCP
mgnify:CR=1 FL=1